MDALVALDKSEKSKNIFATIVFSAARRPFVGEQEA